MTKTKRKLIITFSIIAVVAILIVVFSALFSIKKINVEFVTDVNKVAAYTEEEIVAKSKISKGKSIIFTNTEKCINSLEKSFPYAKFKIVRTFPSTMTVYVYERTPVFKMKNNEQYFEIYDEYLKCLDIVAESSLEENDLANVPTLSGVDVDLCGEEGKFIDNKNLQSKITTIVDGVYGAHKTEIGIMSDIVMGYDSVNGFDVLTLKVRSTQEGKDNAGTIIIQGSSFLKEKIATAVHTYISISDEEEYRTTLDTLVIKILNNFNPNDPTKNGPVVSK